MSRRWLQRAVVIITALSLSVGAAFAATPRRAPQVTISDTKDTKGVLDVRTVRLQSKGGTWFTVIMRKKWTPMKIWDRGNVFVFFDTRGDEGEEYYALVRSDGRTLLGDLWKSKKGAPHHVATLVLSRRSGDGVTIKIPMKKLKFGKKRTTYSWWAITAYTGTKVCRAVCFDRVPDHGSEEQPRPGFKPTVANS